VGKLDQMKIQAFTSSSYMFAIAHGYEILWRGLNQRLKKSNCNVNQALVLIALYFEKSDLVTPSELANAIRTSRGNISHCLSHLEQQRLVKRSLSERDARHLIIHLTPSGKRLAEQLVQSFEEIEAKCEDHFARTVKDKKDIVSSLLSLR